MRADVIADMMEMLQDLPKEPTFNDLRHLEVRIRERFGGQRVYILMDEATKRERSARRTRVARPSK